jgi:putative hydrolase of the HAD superfamily
MARSQPHRNGHPPVVSFDLDGVIMRGPFVSSVRPRIWDHLGRSAGLAHLDAEAREQNIWHAVRAEHDRRLSAGDHVGAWNWQAIYEEVGRGFGGEPVPDVATIVRESCQVDEAVALLPGAAQGLQRLARAGVGIVAITNGYHAFQWPVLEKLQVADFFAAVITPDMAGFAKPDPRIFGLTPGLIAHTGDLLVHDVLGANLAGIQSIWLAPELPDEFVGWSARERPTAPGFDDYVATTLDTSRYRQFHPEATPGSCMPTAVVRDVDEAATVLLDSISAWA